MADEQGSVLESTEPPDDSEDGTTVLELFGVKLTVRNPRLAEVLTTELHASSNLDDRAGDGVVAGERRQEVGQAVPDVVLAPHSPHDATVARGRAELRKRAASAAAALGFEVNQNGVWESPTGFAILTRTVDRPLTLAAAADLSEKLDHVAQELSELSPLSLLVVESQDIANVFRVAIRQRHAYDRMRTITIDNLEFLRSLMAGQVIDHAQAVVLLAPVAGIDVGEVLSIVRSAAAEDEPEPLTE
ncbi:MAG: hypothetical protein OEV43_05085 [Coriobacteriia bacterium]|nr:hypothetical protein [Coriobacteriia bacterium]